MPRTPEEILEEVNAIAQQPDTTGVPHNRQVKRLAVTTAEGVVALHDEVAQLKAITKTLTETTQEYSTSSEKFAKASRLISIAALAVAVLSLFISLYLGISANRSSDAWQEKQLKILNDIRSELRSHGS